MSFYKNKKVLVTGGTGLIGIPLVKILLEKKAKVTVVSLDSKKRAPKNCKFIKIDLRELSNCLKVCKGQDIVFHLHLLYKFLWHFQFPSMKEKEKFELGIF